MKQISSHVDRLDEDSRLSKLLLFQCLTTFILSAHSRQVLLTVRLDAIAVRQERRFGNLFQISLLRAHIKRTFFRGVPVVLIIKADVMNVDALVFGVSVVTLIG